MGKKLFAESGYRCLGLLGVGKRFGSSQREIKAMLVGCVLLAGIAFQTGLRWHLAVKNLTTTMQ